MAAIKMLVPSLDQDIEMRSADLAMTPLMLAERDREYLKQCRR